MEGKILNLEDKGTFQELRDSHKRSNSSHSDHNRSAQPCYHPLTLCNLPLSRSPSPQPSDFSDHNIPLELSKELHTWRTRHGLTGYVNVLEAPPHPEA